VEANGGLWTVAGVARDAAVSQGGGGCVHWPWHEPGPRLGKCAILGYNVTDTLASVLALRYGPLNYSTAACCVPDRLEYFGTDGLGSVRQLYDSAGHIVANRRYEPFGSLLSASGTGTSSYDYAGEQRDASTGLLYLRARCLDTYLNQSVHPSPIPSDRDDESVAGNGSVGKERAVRHCRSESLRVGRDRARSRHILEGRASLSSGGVLS
jgi:hypothetical protein